MSSPRISARGAGARSRARAKRPKAVPCAARTAAHGSLVVASVPALAQRGGGRGARSTATKERAPQLHASQDAEAVPAPQHRVGGADASAEERPGAALARDDVGPRSAAREHRRRVRRRDRESRCQAIQRPRGARTARPRRCRPNSVRPQGSPQRAISEAEAMPRRRAGPARSGAERFMSAGASPMAPIGLRGAARRASGGGPGRCLWRAPCSRLRRCAPRSTRAASSRQRGNRGNGAGPTGTGPVGRRPRRARDGLRPLRPCAAPGAGPAS